MTEELPNNDQSAHKADVEMLESTEPNPNGFFSDINNAQACSVRVALRVRPLSSKENLENSRVCIATNDYENQVKMDKSDKIFTFDKTFDMHSTQESVFETCVKNLVLGCFSGFNATVLAYGQTGSGKTFTMGSGFAYGVQEDALGIIPRVIRLIFQEEERRRHQALFTIKCSFLEIYNEELIDLLDGSLEKGNPQRNKINVREEKNGTISVQGLNEVTVKSQDEMASYLDIGSNARRTASTLMNLTSSRSHGIFTITIEQHPFEESADGVAAAQVVKPTEFIVAKFHFVDLAGSERVKKTGATGSTLKEGININKSLLALGNVISALTDETKKAGHIPYRDSKLTRILQDSLGGNSRTSMIACCSPAESNYDETLNTLIYASRAREIKNKPVINRDPASQLIAELKVQVFELQKELIGSRKLLLNNGIQFESCIDLPTDINLDGPIINKPAPAQPENNKVLEAIIKDLKHTIVQRDQTIAQLQVQCSNLKLQADQLQIGQLDNLKQRDEARFFAEQLTKRLSDLGQPVYQLGDESNILEEYRQNNVSLEKQVAELRQMLQILQNDNQSLITQAQKDTENLESQQVEIEKLKLQGQRQKVELEKATKELKLRNEMQRQAPFPQNAKNDARASIVKPDAHLLENEWLSQTLNQKIKDFQEIGNIVIKKFGNQMTSNIIVGESAAEQELSNDDEEMASEMENEIVIDAQAMNTAEQQVVAQEGQLIEQKNNLKQLDTQVKDQEDLLSAFKKSQMELQNSLLFAMKEEYHKKLESLSSELQRLDQEKSLQLTKAQGAQRVRIEDQFKKKQQELEQQIQQMAKKDRETKQMQKSLEEQQKRVKMLEQDIDKMKTQRVIMLKKAKDDQEQLARIKQERNKELQALKSQFLKKEKEIVELKRDAGKKEIFAKRKAEELQAMQQRQKLDQQKRQNAKQTRQQLKQVDFDQIRAWIIESTQRMVEFSDLQQQRDKKDSEFHEVDAEIEGLQHQFGKLVIAQQRQQDIFEPFQLSNEIRQVKEQMEILEEKRNFINNKVIEIDRQLIESRPESSDTRIFDNVQSIEGARACIEICFQLLFELTLTKNETEKDNIFYRSKVNELDDQLRQFEQLQQANIAHENRERVWFNELADKFGVDTSQIEPDNFEQLLHLCFSTKQPNFQNVFTNDALNRAAFAKFENRETKIDQANQNKAALQQTISDLRRQLSQSESIIQKQQIETQQFQQERARYKKLYEDLVAKQRKQSFLGNDEPGMFLQSQQKTSDSLSFVGAQKHPLASAKTVTVSYKDARNARKLKKVEENGEQPVVTELILEDNNDDVFNRLNIRSRAFTTRGQSRPNSQLMEYSEESFPDTQNWTITCDKLDAHKNQVFAMANLDHQLYSGSNKSLKIWDLNEMKLVSELSENIGLIKSISVCKERKILMVQSDRSIMVWELVGLTKIAEFKGHNEIKCLEIVEGDTMFAGTKGSQTSGSLLIFDLRKSYVQTVDEKVKNQEILSLKATSKWLFMGCRSHKIFPLDLNTRIEPEKELQPPHMDAVTCLGTIGGETLISGSKDKHLRSYNIGNQYFEQRSSVMNAHNDQISSLDSLKGSSHIYSGSRDGIVKVWTQQEGQLGELKCLAKLDGNGTQSGINAVCALDTQFGASFATANNDKSIRIWSNMTGKKGNISQRNSTDLMNDEEIQGLIGGGALSQLRNHRQNKKQKPNQV